MSIRKFPLLQLILLGLALTVLWFGLRTVSLAAIWQLLKKLGWQQIAWLVVLNGMVWIFNALRWWLFLWARGARVGYWRLFGYRFAVFAASYLTPGPQFGGEVLQIYLPNRRDGIAAPIALAAMTGDKLIELLTNFLFLAGGTIFVISQGLLPGLIGNQTLLFNLTLPLLPLTLIFLLWYGYRPLSQLLEHLPRRKPFGQTAKETETTSFIERRTFSLQQLIESLRAGEEQTILLIQKQPGIMLITQTITLLSWLFMIAEMWYVAGIVGMTISLSGIVAVMVALRLVYLIPVPAGIGAVEAGLLFAFTALGQSAESAIALSLLMRGRDILQLLLGLWVGGSELLRSIAIPNLNSQRRK